MAWLKRKPKTPPPKSLRTGVLETSFVGAGLLNKGDEYRVAIEVSEWERLGDLSRISIRRVSGAGSHDRDVRQRIPEWLPTSSVLWRD